MSVIYSEEWYGDMKRLINDCDAFRSRAPRERVAMAIEVIGDEQSPYVNGEVAVHYLVVLDGGSVVDYRPMTERHDGKGLSFRFTAPASVWEQIAAGLVDPITAGLRGHIRIRGDMRFLMKNADAVKLLVDLYGQQVHTEWPKGKPPYAASHASQTQGRTEP